MVRHDPLEYAQAEDDFVAITKDVVRSVKIAQRLGVAVAFLLIALLFLAIAVVGKLLLGLL